MKPAYILIFVAFGFLAGLGLGLIGPDALSPIAPSTSTPTMDASHDHSTHAHDDTLDLASGPDAPTLDVTLSKDPASGWNLHILTSNFRFAPQHASQDNQPGEGHAHIYVNGEKLARVYGNWFHIASLPAGAIVMVGLYANDHSMLSVDGQHLRVTRNIP